MARIFNPGEPLFDQVTGDLVVDPATQDAVIVAAEGVYVDPETSLEYPLDDVGNACFYAANTYTGEALRDQSVGVDYVNVVFASPFVPEIAAAEVSAAIKVVPGVAAVIGARFLSLDPVSRVGRFAFDALKKSGQVVAGDVPIG